MPSPLVLPFALANLLLLAGALAASRRELRSALPGGGGERRALFLLLILAFAVRAGNPYHPVPGMEEGFFLDQADGLVHHQLNAICSTGSMGQRLLFDLYYPLGERGVCQQFATYFPVGYPMVLSLASVLLGFSTVAARAVGVLGGTATVACVYMLAYLLTKDRRSALVAGLVLALLPMHVRFGAKGLSEVLSILTEVLAVLAAVLHLRTGRRAPAWLAAASLALHITIKNENLLALVPLFVVYWWGRRRPPLLPWLLALALVTPHLADWGETRFGQETSTTILDFGSVHRNVWYVTYWFDGYFQPWLFTALAVMGGICLLRIPAPGGLLVACWIVARLTLYLLTTLPAFTPRYMLGLSVPFALVCGVGALALPGSLFHLEAAVVLSGLAHLPFAYGPMFGHELPGDTRSMLSTLHLALPLLTLIWVAWCAEGAWRRRLTALALAGAVVITVLYPSVAPGDDIPRPIREAVALEESTFDGWERMVGGGCYVVGPQAMRTRTLWGRHPVVPGTQPALEGTEAGLRSDVASLLAREECVYLYDNSRGSDPGAVAMREGFELTLLDRVIVPPELVEAAGDVREHALYRVSPSRG